MPKSPQVFRADTKCMESLDKRPFCGWDLPLRGQGKRQKQVFKMFNNDTQIFITCTSVEGISEDLLNNSNIIVDKINFGVIF